MARVIKRAPLFLCTVLLRVTQKLKKHFLHSRYNCTVQMNCL